MHNELIYNSNNGINYLIIHNKCEQKSSMIFNWAAFRKGAAALVEELGHHIYAQNAFTYFYYP